MKSNYDYTQTMMMKIDVGIPDNMGGCKIHNTFEQVLEKIKAADALTLGAPKIVYLVGWQYLGHDDKYPAFFEVNETVKRAEDKTARDSLLWLYEEAKKYNTVLSYHINLTDAYPDSPLWREYLENDLILKNIWGRPKVTGIWNGRKSYQVRYGQEYESGYFKKRVDKLLELLPVQEAGTVHADAFFVRRGKNTSIKSEKLYRRKMIEYFNQKGIDVTSEFIYRERSCGLRLHTGKSDVIGVIPAFWNLALTQKDYLKYPAKSIAGGKLNMGIQRDKDLQYLFYGNTTGEASFNEKEWVKPFTKEFALGSLLYFYLNQSKLLKIEGSGKHRTAYFTNNIETSVENKTIKQNGHILKEEGTLCVPVVWKPGSYYAWSDKDCKRSFNIPFREAEIFEITPNGNVPIEKRVISDGRLELELSADKGYEIKERLVK